MRKLLLIIFLFSQANAVPVHSFDVIHYELYFDIYDCFLPPYPHTYSAYNVMTFKADSLIGSINLDADNISLIIDSVFQGNNRLEFTQSPALVNINLGRNLLPGEEASLKIYFRHTVARDGAFYTGNRLVYADTQADRCRCRFGCWDKPCEKALLDRIATVPSNLKLY